MAASALLTFVAAVTSCEKDGFEKDYPVPNMSLTKVTLNEAQYGYMTAGNQFSLGLLHHLYKGKNTVVSPLGVQMALGMSLNGARGATADEIIDVLGYGTNKEKDINEYCQVLLEQLPALDKSVKLKFADAVVTDTGFGLTKSFKNTLKDYYYAPAESYSLKSSEALGRINEWASRNTEGLINPFIDKIPDNTVALLLNSVYFKARWWSSMFMYEDKESRDFIMENGKAVKVNYLRAHAELGYNSSDVLWLLNLPYAGEAFSMYILLPKDESEGSCNRLLKSLSESSLKALMETEQKFFTSVYLPEFDITSDLKLKTTLQALGIKKAFDDIEADFSRMYNKTPESNNLYISDFLQKTRIMNTNWGTEAASGTVAEYGDPIEAEMDDEGILVFDANHPFIFLIVEKLTGAIIFEGVFSAQS